MSAFRSLVFCLVFVPGGARRSIRVDDSHGDAQQHDSILSNRVEVSAEAREALIPGGLGARILRRAGYYEPQQRAARFRFGPRHTKVALQAAAGPEEELLPSAPKDPKHTAADSSSEAAESAVTPTEEPKPEQKTKPTKRAAWREGIFAPLVLGAKSVMGEQELKQLRADVIRKHSKVISDFVDTSESKFGQLVLRRMFEYADKDGSGALDKEEVRDALYDLGFNFVDEKQLSTLMKNSDKDQNDVIDFEEFVKSTPKALRINLVKLAKQNGDDLGFLV